MESATDDSEDRERASREATEWFVRLNNPLASEATRRSYQTWLAADPAHHDAMRDVSELWGALDRPAAQLAANGWHRAPDRSERQRRTGLLRGFRYATAATVMVLLSGGVAIWRDAGLLDRAFADVATWPGERREVRLVDGTTAFLDGDTALDSRMGKELREITLLRGRVWFDVASDKTRPFIVHAGRVDSQVLGTAFGVDREAGAVTVERGEVAVSDAHLSRSPVRLKARQGVALQNGSLGSPVAVDPDQALAWRRGLIILDRAPLSRVVEELGKMTPGRVLFANPELKRLTLSGTFRADDPATVLEAVRSALNVRILSVPGFATLIYR
jgi:transmembrane sensor